MSGSYLSIFGLILLFTFFVALLAYDLDTLCAFGEVYDSSHFIINSSIDVPQKKSSSLQFVWLIS